MTPAEFEDYVEFVLRQLDVVAGAEVIRNRRFATRRQPGSYEVDIAVRAKLSGQIDFFMIVECKNWSRPVDRPVVQQLVQTKDALGAHKAAIASPVGFTRGAIELAEVLGVALWVVAETKSELTIVRHLSADRRAGATAGEVHSPLEFREPYFPDLGLVLVDVASCRPSPEARLPFAPFAVERVSGDVGSKRSCRRGVDPRMAATQIGRMVGR